MRALPGQHIADFLEDYAGRNEGCADELVDMANEETALPKTPRLAGVELPRTVNQLQLAAKAARSGSWRCPVLDTKANIRSCYGPIGPVVVFGPNNFPFAFGSISGGDFAAAIAAGNPVIAKANTSHPDTTRLLAEQALVAANVTNMPPGTVQLIYRTSHADGERLASDPRVGATAYTGSRTAGLKLKAAADAAGKPIYLELSSINPVVILPGALQERGEDIVEEFKTSCLMGTGQFCTNPGLVILIKGEQTTLFIEAAKKHFEAAPEGLLLSEGVRNGLQDSLKVLTKAGADPIVGDRPGKGGGYCYANTLLTVPGRLFIDDPETFQVEAFGNSSLFVICDDIDQAGQVLSNLEGQLTGCIYSDTTGSEDAVYAHLERTLRSKVGRLLNDQMPTGVAVSPAMNHGGPFPATGHSGFTAVGMPTSIPRFAQLHCYDKVREHRLPDCLKDNNPNGELWRLINGSWTKINVGDLALSDTD